MKEFLPSLARAGMKGEIEVTATSSWEGEYYDHETLEPCTARESSKTWCGRRPGAERVAIAAAITEKHDISESQLRAIEERASTKNGPPSANPLRTGTRSHLATITTRHKGHKEKYKGTQENPKRPLI